MGRSTNDPNNYIAVGKQSARDVEASSFYFLRHLDGSMIDPNPDVQREREGGSGQRIGFSYRSRVQADPRLSAYARVEYAGVVLGGVLGADASVGSVGLGLYQHLLVPTTVIPYYTVDERSINEVSRALNCKFTQVEISWESGRPLRIDAEMINGGTYFGRPIASALTPVREVGKPLFYPFASVGITGGASAASADVTKGKLTITRDIDGDIQGNSLARSDVVEQNQDYQLDLTVKMEDEQLWRQAHLSGGSAAGIDLATLAFNLYTSNVGNLRINAPLMEVVGLKLNKLDPDGKTMFYDIAAADVGHASHPVFAQVLSGATAPY
jgi:hypothetical protein